MWIRVRSAPNFSVDVYCVQTAGWIKIPLGKVLGLGPASPGHIMLDGDPVGTQPPTVAPPHFRPMPIVAKRSPISATAELLSIMYSLLDYTFYYSDYIFRLNYALKFYCALYRPSG